MTSSQNPNVQRLVKKAKGLRRRAGAAKRAWLAYGKPGPAPAADPAEATGSKRAQAQRKARLLPPPKAVGAPGTRASTRFFDDYPRFFETSKTSPYPWRLNLRYDAIFDEHRELFAGKSVLDIACHDGRWSLAALKTGASSVVGIEARPELVANAEQNLAHYGYSPEQYTFVSGDIFSVLATQEYQVDVVLCLGFLYHTLRYNELMKRIDGLGPKVLIIDSESSPLSGPLVEVRAERVAREGNAVADEFSSGDAVFSGVPTEAAVKTLVESYGYRVDAMSDWGALIRDNPEADGIGDYRSRRRFTMVCSKI